MSNSNEASEPNVVFRRAKNRSASASSTRRAAKPTPAESASSGASDLDDRAELATSGRVSSALKRRQLRQRKMLHTTSKRKRTQLEALASDTSSEDVDEDVADSRYDGPDVRYSSSRTIELSGPSDMGATARSEIDTEYDRDAQAQFERVQKSLREQPTGEEKIYRGMALYGAKLKADTARGSASSGLNRAGPIRATQYMRSSVRWDYAPDICKDYKETGYCTFGDSCKFMHDRSDYKHGWQLEREWEQGKFKEANADEYLVSSEAEGSDEDNLPFSCYICRESFKNPVVTKCKHYFCEACALKRAQKTKKCAVCDANTEGQFRTAKEIIARIGKAAKSEAKNEDETARLSDDEEDGNKAPTSVMTFLPADEENDDVKGVAKAEDPDE